MYQSLCSTSIRLFWIGGRELAIMHRGRMHFCKQPYSHATPVFHFNESHVQESYYRKTAKRKTICPLDSVPWYKV